MTVCLLIGLLKWENNGAEKNSLLGYLLSARQCENADNEEQ
jgi:hypothetical protein